MAACQPTRPVQSCCHRSELLPWHQLKQVARLAQLCSLCPWVCMNRSAFKICYQRCLMWLLSTPVASLVVGGGFLQDANLNRYVTEATLSYRGHRWVFCRLKSCISCPVGSLVFGGCLHNAGFLWNRDSTRAFATPNNDNIMRTMLGCSFELHVV